MVKLAITWHLFSIRLVKIIYILCTKFVLAFARPDIVDLGVESDSLPGNDCVTFLQHKKPFEPESHAGATCIRSQPL
jgi:hypothetical protein